MPRRLKSSFNLAEIDLKAFSHNYQTMASLAPEALMAVIKGDAYGHGLVECAKAAIKAGANDLGVLDLEEALTIRKELNEANIHVLAGLHGPDQAARAISAGLTIFGYSLGQMTQLSHTALKLGSQAKIMVKIDTGMGRLGLPWDQSHVLLSEVAVLEGLKIQGLATHLATLGDQGALEQLERFRQIVRIADKSFKGPLRHSALSGGALLCHSVYPDNVVRAGLTLYGYGPTLDYLKSVKAPPKALETAEALKPVMKVKSQIIQVREIKAGETISYDRTFVASKEATVATVPFGYVHGLSRTRSSKGYILINGQKAPLLGRVCMNLSVYDVTNLKAKAGDEVVILGEVAENIIGADLIAQWSNTSPYEVLCLLGRLNPRLYLGLKSDS
ncbi:MAG: alanine racemase [Deltaproteobacteria bacterium]|jgi:alanine racemase|nr:alanine racemase [Deltaproteobacteria bacterium]